MKEIRIVRDKVELEELLQMAQDGFLDFVKAVVDVEHETMAVGGQMHADAEKVLLEEGSSQANLWGINIFPHKPREQMVEYTSLINIRPRQGNRKMAVESAEVREKIQQIVWKLVAGSN